MSKFIWGVKNTIQQSDEIKERLKTASNIVFHFDKEKPIEGNYSCFKMRIGNKYYIAKTKTCMWLEQHLNKLLKAYYSNGIDSTDLYHPIVKRIHTSGIYDINIEFICQSENAYEVIKAELEALYQYAGTLGCMNKNVEPYMPKYNRNTKMYGWLTKNQFLNYKKLVIAYAAL